MFCKECGHVLNADNFCVNPNCPSNDESNYIKKPRFEEKTKEQKREVYTQTFDLDEHYYNNNPYNRDISIAATVEDFEVYVGPKKTSYYLDRFMDYQDNQSFLKWNWSAFLCGFYWLLYRKLYSDALFYFAVNSLLTKAITRYLDLGIYEPLATLVKSLALMTIVGLFGNQQYVKNAVNKISKTKSSLSGMDKDFVYDRIRKIGGTNLWLPLTILGIGILLLVIALTILGSYFIRFSF